MSLIGLPEAKAHLRLESDYPDDQVQPKLSAAEQGAMQFINRRAFEDAAEQAIAIAGLPAMLTAAGVAYKAAIEAAFALEDCDARNAAIEYACQARRDALTMARETYASISKDDPRWPIFESGALLILGHLFANREDVVVGASVAEMPNGSGHVLYPLRVGLGV